MMEDDDAAIEVRNHVSPEPEVEDAGVASLANPKVIRCCMS